MRCTLSARAGSARRCGLPAYDRLKPSSPGGERSSLALPVFSNPGMSLGDSEIGDAEVIDPLWKWVPVYWGAFLS